MNTQTQACDFPSLWSGYVNEGKLEELVALYSESSVLMPTFSPHNVRNKEQLEEYFTKLASRESLSVSLHENTVVCQKTGELSYIITGIYSFKFEVDGTLLTFPSRFTFVIDLSQESPILHHHSSQIPRNLS